MEILSYLVVLAVSVVPTIYGLLEHNALASRRNDIIGAASRLRAALIDEARLAAQPASSPTSEGQTSSKSTKVSSRPLADLLRERPNLIPTDRPHEQSPTTAEQFAGQQEILRAAALRVDEAIGHYNTAVARYERRRVSFPASFIASLFAFQPVDLLPSTRKR